MRESLEALATLKGFLSTMQPLVLLEVMLVLKGFAAFLALVGPGILVMIGI